MGLWAGSLLPWPTVSCEPPPCRRGPRSRLDSPCPPPRRSALPALGLHPAAVPGGLRHQLLPLPVLGGRAAGVGVRHGSGRLLGVRGVRRGAAPASRARLSAPPLAYQAPAAPASGCSLNLMAAPTRQELARRACAGAAADCGGAFFSRDAAAGALLLVDLPEAVVRMVLQEGKTPHGARRCCRADPAASGQRLTWGMCSCVWVCAMQRQKHYTRGMRQGRRGKSKQDSSSTKQN